MSEPKRYIFRIRECGCVKPEHLEGKYAPSALIIEETEEKCGWVRYEDYARLKAEVERLRIAGSESEPRFVLLSDYRHLKSETDNLKAEVERLTKELENTDCMFAMASAFARDWNAAKEGNGQP
jgi:hypothetical protein